jgi:transcription initiation factor IIE alpha subunit
VSSFFILLTKNAEEKEIYVISESEEKKGVFLAYELLFICQHCGA